MAVSVMIYLRHFSAIFILHLISNCSSFTFEGSSASFSKFSSWVPCHNGTLSFEFKTSSPNALLMYTDSGNKLISHDYFELKLVNGILQLRFKLNDERKMITSAKGNLNDNEWHSLNIIRSGRRTTLEVDKVSRMVENSHYEDTHITFGDSQDSYVYIGGLPMEFNSKLERLAHAQAKFEPSLRGSVRNVFFSNCGKVPVSPKLLESEGIIFDTDKCMENNPCQNNGICTMRDSGIKCDCSYTNFVGDFCQNGKC